MKILARAFEPMFTRLHNSPGAFAFRPWGGWGAAFRVDAAEKEALVKLMVHHVELAALFVAIRLIVDLVAGAHVAALFAGRPAPADLLLGASLAALAVLHVVRLRRRTAGLARLPAAAPPADDDAMTDWQAYGFAALGALVTGGSLVLAVFGWIADETDTLVLGLGGVALFAWIAAPYMRAALVRLSRRNPNG